MKMKRVMVGWYKSEDGRWKVQRYRGQWEIYLDNKYWSHSYSLADAKKQIEEGEK